MKNNKNLFIILGALFFFLILSTVYFSPLIGGKALFQSDIMQYKGAAQEQNTFRETYKEETYWSNSMFGGMPNYQSGAVYQNDFIKKIDSALRLFLPRPLDYLFITLSGFFFLLMVWLKDWRLAIMGAVFFGFSTYIFIIMGAGHNAKVHTIAYFAPFVAGLILLFRKKYIIGTIVTTLFLGLQLSANHPQMSFYLFMGLLFFGLVQFISFYKKGNLKDFFKAVSLSILALFFALGMNANKFLSTYEYSKETIRGKSELKTNEKKNDGLEIDYITQWSYGILETINLMVPNFYGGGNQEKDFKAEKFENESKIYQNRFYQRAEPLYLELDSLQKLAQLEPSNTELQQVFKEKYESFNQLQENFGKPLQSYSGSYWGEQPFTTGPAYQGILVVLLAIFAVFWYPSKHKWWLLGATLLSFMMAWGKNLAWFTNFMVDYFPFYNKFRAVSSALVLAEFTIPILATMGVYSIIKYKEEIFKNKSTIFGMGIFTLVMLVFYFLGDSILNFANTNELEQLPVDLLSAIKEDRFLFFQKDILRTLIFAIFGFMGLFLFIKNKISSTIFIGVITLLSLVDLWWVDKRYLNEESFVSKKYMQNPFPTEVTETMIMDAEKEPELNRIFGLANMNAKLKDLKEKDNSYYRVFNVAYNPFNETNTSFFHHSIGGYHGAKLRSYQNVIDRYLSNQPNIEVLNMLNTKYIITGDTQNPEINPNIDFNGGAWFVNNVRMAITLDESFNALENISSKKEAIVNIEEGSRFVFQKNNTLDTLASIKIINYKPNHITYQSNSQTEQFAVFSEIYYNKGWNAYLDGKEVPYYRTNYFLRGMKVPKGKHSISFKFEPKVVQLGNTISSIIFFLFLLGSLFFVWTKYKGKFNKKIE